MKIKSYPPILALLLLSGFLNAQVTINDDVVVNGDGNPATPSSTVNGDSLVDGNATVTGDTTVNGTLTVQAAPTPVVVTPNNNNLGQMNAVPGTNDGTSTAFQTVIGGTEAAYTDATGGGAVIQNNGDTTLNAATGNDNTVTVSRVTEVRIFNADQGANAGQPVPDSQSYYLVDGNGVEIAGSRVSVGDPGVPDAATAQTNFEELVDGDGVGDLDFTSSDFDSARVTTPLAPTGGNLTVGGNATISGQTTTNGIDNSGEAITNIADGTADTDAASVGQVNAAVGAEEAARIAADDILQDNIDTEAATRAAADVVLQDNIDAEAATRAAADVVLQDNIDAEAATRAAADVVLQDNIDAEAATRAAADVALQGDIDQEIADRSKLIDTVGQNADGNEIIHIGPHSLVTQELGGQQLLSAQDAGANPIDIRVTGGSNLLVDNNLGVGGNLTVNGSTTTNGINNSGARITNVGDGILLGDAVNVRQLNNETNARIAGDRRLDDKIDTNTRGIAMVAAMTNTTVAPDMKQAVDFNWANFEGENGFGLGYAYRVNANLQLNAAAASTTDFDESVVRLGVSYQW